MTTRSGRDGLLSRIATGYNRDTMGAGRLFCVQAALAVGALVIFAGSTAADPKLEELINLALDSKDGVVRLTDQNFAHFVDGDSRAYSLFLMCTAKHLMDKEGLNLRDLRKRFGEVAGIIRSTTDSMRTDKVILAEVEFTTDQDVFRRLDVKTLPLILRVAQHVKIAPGSVLKLPESDIMSSTNFPMYPWKAGEILTFVEQTTGAFYVPPKPPSVTERPWFPFAALAGLAVVCVVAYKLYYAPFLRYRWLYLLGGLVVYWFSVSGGMYNIIRGMPMTIPGKGGPQLFMQGQGQLGAEGFIMGSRYTGFGLALAFATLVAPKIKSPTGQRVLAYLCLVIAFLCLNAVISVYKWKTGYGVHSYLFD